MTYEVTRVIVLAEFENEKDARSVLQSHQKLSDGEFDIREVK